MSVERCGECGFDSDDWSDAGAIAAIQRLPTQWTAAVVGLAPSHRLRRPVDQMWSIAEYADHVREVLFGMRFLLDTAISQPGTDLGMSPAQPFTSRPRQIDVEAALSGIDHEARSLSQRLSELDAVLSENPIALLSRHFRKPRRSDYLPPNATTLGA